MKLYTYKLEDVLEIKYGKNQKNVKDDDGPYPIYGTGGLMGYANDFLYDKPSVLIGRKGSISKVRYIDEPFWTVDTLFYTKINEEIVYPRFIYYYLSLIDFSYYNEGTTIPSLRTQTLNQIEITIPDKTEQLKILNVIDPIDEKIQLNEATNHTIEKIARAVFKHWFVDFEFPNEHGEPYKSSGGKFVESDLGMIPEGWKISALKPIINITSGKRPNSKQDEKDAEYSIPLLGASSQMGYVNDFLYDAPILIIGRVGTHGVVQRMAEKCWPSDNTLVIQSDYYYFMYQILQHIDYSALNRGSTQPLITQRDIKNYQIILPEQAIIEKYEQFMEKLFTRTNNNHVEKKNLINLRDALLPKMIAGEIQIPTLELEIAAK